MVLAILGLALAFVAMRGPPRSAGLDLRGAAGEVAQTLRLARARAITGNRPVGVAFDGAANLVRLDGAAPRALPPGIAMAVTATADNAAGSIAAIRFAPDGSSSGGRVELESSGRRIQVGVDWLTGRVSVANGA